MWEIYSLAKEIGFPVQTVMLVGFLIYLCVKYFEKKFGKNNPGTHNNSGKHIIKSDECGQHRKDIYNLIKENNDKTTEYFLQIKEDIGSLKK